jgi:hypothetical protein
VSASTMISREQIDAKMSTIAPSLQLGRYVRTCMRGYRYVVASLTYFKPFQILLSQTSHLIQTSLTNIKIEYNNRKCERARSACTEEAPMISAATLKQCSAGAKEY